MKRKLHKISYTHRIALVILFFTLVPCLMFGSIYLNIMQTNWKEDILLEYQNDAEFNALLASKNITELQSKMQYILNNFEIRSYLSKLDEIHISKALDFVAATENAVSSIVVANQNLEIRWFSHKSNFSFGKYCFTLNRFAEEFPNASEDTDYQEILNLNEGTYLWKVRNISRGENNKGPSEPRLCLYTQINTMYSPDCVLEFSIPVAIIANTPKSNLIPNSLFALSLNQLVQKPMDIILTTTLSEQESFSLLNQYHEKHTLTDYEIIRASIPNVTDSEILFFIPKSHVSTLIMPQIMGFVSIAVLIAILILFTCYLTSYLLTRRIIHAINSINTDLKSTLTEPLHDEYSHDDIGQIAMQVRKLVQDTQEYCLKIEHYESENLRIELELLQMRFNPHLLYNTLDAIYYQIKNPAARCSIESLCNYYRIVLNNGHLIIQIKDEINMIKDYLSIVKFAYGLDNISFEFNLDEQIMQYTIIKHLLQPIVENALNHGIRPAMNNGILKIQTFTKKDYVYIQVIDNGVGMSEEETERLLKEPSASVSDGGYGIFNVHQRIQLYYGNEYGLEILSKTGEGTTVTIRIPKLISPL